MKKSLKTTENLDSIIVVRLPIWAKEKLIKIAKSKSLGASTLARMWIIEKMQSSPTY